MIIKEMTITNNRGDSITFGHHFKLQRVVGLSGTSATNNYTEGNFDGSSYQNTFLDNKEFGVLFYIDRTFSRDILSIEERRALAFKVFNPKFNPFRVDIKTKADKEYYLIANLDSAVSFPEGNENQNEAWHKGTIYFTANDPYFYEKNSKKVEVASWIGSFEFPLEIVEDGIELGYREQSLIANVTNDGANDTGMIIQFKAQATVLNPSLININTYEELKLNFEMIGGDIIEVSTYKGQKSVTLIRNNVKSNIFNTLDLSSTFLELSPGDNLFRYNADEGLDNLEISMTFNNKYVGV